MSYFYSEYCITIRDFIVIKSKQECLEIYFSAKQKTWFEFKIYVIIQWKNTYLPTNLCKFVGRLVTRRFGWYIWPIIL